MFILGVSFPVPSTPDWQGLVDSLNPEAMPKEGPGVERGVETVSTSTTGDPKKRRRGVSPVQRCQRPRLSFEEVVKALHCLSPEQQEMVEKEARRGVSGEKVLHR